MECKYHVVFTPKHRKKALFGQIRRHLGTVFRELAQRKECKIVTAQVGQAFFTVEPEIFLDNGISFRFKDS